VLLAVLATWAIVVPAQADDGLGNLARNAAVKARTRLESPPFWSKDNLVDGVYAAGGYGSHRAGTERIHVTLEMGTLTGAWRTFAHRLSRER